MSNPCRLVNLYSPLHMFIFLHPIRNSQYGNSEKEDLIYAFTLKKRGFFDAFASFIEQVANLS